MSNQTMNSEKAVTLLRVLASKLTRLAGVGHRDEAWRNEWRRTFNQFYEVLPLTGRDQRDTNVYVIEDYKHRSVDFGNGNFAINTVITGKPKWLFVNPRTNGHQWYYDTLEHMLNSIYLYSSVFVFSDDIFTLDETGRAKWLKPLRDEPVEVQPIIVPPNMSEQERQLIEKVNRLIEMNNKFLCMHPFTIISGCYELAEELAGSLKTGDNDGLLIVRPPFTATPLVVTDRNEIHKLVWESLRQAYPYDLCGDANCKYIFVVDDMNVLLIIPWKYSMTHRYNDIGVRMATFKIDEDALTKQ